MKKATKLLSLLLVFCLLIGSFSLPVSAGGEQEDYYADDTKLWIDSTEPTILGSSKLNGKGWSFDPSGNVLTLSGFTGKFLLSNKPLIIVLKAGTTNIFDYGICSEDNLTICGDGVLNLGKRIEIAYGTLTVAGGTVNVEEKTPPSFEINLKIYHYMPEDPGYSCYENTSWDLTSDIGFHAKNGTGVSLGMDSQLLIKKGTLNVSNTSVGVGIYPMSNEEKGYVQVQNGKLRINSTKFGAIHTFCYGWKNPSLVFNSVTIKDTSGKTISLTEPKDKYISLYNESGENIKSAIVEAKNDSVAAEADKLYNKYFKTPNNDNKEETSSKPKDEETSSKPKDEETSSKPKDEETSSKPKDEETTKNPNLTSSAGSLSSIDYLAFSALSYFDWKPEQKIEDKIKTLKDPLFNKTFIKYLKDQHRPQNEINFYSITYNDLCKNILKWKVLRTSGSSASSFETGFYAVTFYNSTLKQAVIAYRGSNISFTKDALNDWVQNDIPFHTFNEYTGQLTDAMEYYQQNISSNKLSGYNVSVTGHSLGGALAETASISYNVYGEVFNAASPYEALYSNKPEILGESFIGVDKWNFTAHINKEDYLVGAWNNEHLNLPHVIHESGIGVVVLIEPHSLESLVYREDSDGKLRMANVNTTPSTPKSFLSTFESSNKNVGLYLGTSKEDASLRSIDATFSGDAMYLYGGFDNDKLLVPVNSHDTLIGGKARTLDVLDGGWGNDTYIYYKGDGLHYIHDIEGNDTLKILGLSKNDKVELISPSSNKEYQMVLINDKVCVCINNNRHITDPFHIEALDKRLEMKGRIKNPFGIYACCPIDIDIVDPSGATVLTLKDGEEMTKFTTYGSFYVVVDEDGESRKLFYLDEGYTAKIRGVGKGTMDLTVIGDCSNPDMPSMGAMNIPITTSFTATIKTAAGKNPVLLVDNKGKTEEIVLTEQKTITLDANGGKCGLTTIKTDFEGKVTNLPVATKEGFSFAGWETADGKLVTDTYTFKNDATLTAKWISVESSPNISGTASNDTLSDADKGKTENADWWWIIVVVVVVVVATSIPIAIIVIKKKQKHI